MKLLFHLVASLTIFAAAAFGQVQFQYDGTRLKDLRVQGMSMLGNYVDTNGAYIVGSKNGSDNSGFSVTSVGGANGLMHSDNPGLVPPPPYSLTWNVSGNTLDFIVTVGPVATNFDSISFPIDFSKLSVQGFAFAGSQYRRVCTSQNGIVNASSGTYASIVPICPIPGIAGNVGAAETVNAPTWAEVNGTLATVRLKINSSSHYKHIRFYNHPGTNNMEIGFGTMFAGESAMVSGRLIVTPNANPCLRFESEGNLVFHQVGYPEAGGWAVNTSLPANKYLAFGPYTTHIVSGSRTARYRLMLDNVTANNAKILKLDVFDASTGQVLASRDVRRGEFAAPFAYKDFDVAFTPAPGHRLEFRSYWLGGSYVRQDNVMIK